MAGTIVVVIAMVLLWRYARRRTQNGKLIWTKILQFLLKFVKSNVVYVVGKIVGKLIIL